MRLCPLAGDKFSVAFQRMRLEMVAAGVAPKRLVLTPHLPNGEHMIAMRHAAVHLDTPAYNGGITLVDVLFAGLPAVAMAGEHGKLSQRFCKRVGGWPK